MEDPTGWRIPWDGGSHGKHHEPGLAALVANGVSTKAMPVISSVGARALGTDVRVTEAAAVHLARGLVSIAAFTTSPQPAGGEDVHIWKQLQLSRFKEILHRGEENPIPRPSSPLPPSCSDR